jgi:hypothetical protein
MSGVMPACGTPNGYKAHRRRNEDACTPCRNANNTHMNTYRRARTRAVDRLINNHRGEYARYLAEETAKEAA